MRTTKKRLIVWFRRRLPALVPAAFPFWAECSGFPRLFAHYLNDDAFGALSVEFGVVNLLPGAEIQPALGHRHDDLVVYE
jgi:hypothetical protein